MFPLAFVFLAVAFFSAGSLRKAALRVLVAGAVFLAVGSPVFISLSRAMGRPTFGESGRLNYIYYVDRPDYSSLPPNTFRHPPHTIHAAPFAYEFARPIKGTFPFWYDPAYWNEGLKAHINLKGQFRVLRWNGINYYQLVFLPEAALMAGLIVLFSASPGGLGSLLTSVRDGWCLMVPAAAGLGAFMLLIVQGRYIGPYVLLLWLGVLCGVRTSTSEESRKWVAAAVLAIVVTQGAPVVSSVFLNFFEQRHKGPVDWEAAQALSQAGIRQGDEVAYIRRSYGGDFFWARLARIRIIAEIPPEEVDKFWAASPVVQADVMRAFEGVGAKAVITSAPPSCAPPAVWRQLGSTNFYVYLPRLDSRHP